MAPRKVRLVGDMLRGLTVNEAEAQLLHERRRAAKPLLKLLRSAVANVKAISKTADQSALYIRAIQIDKGPMLKRSLPRARGMATPIHKFMTHVTLTLAESQESKKPRFTIVVPKKSKSSQGSRSAPKKPSPQREGREGTRERQKSGFFRKMFSRKSI